MSEINIENIRALSWKQPFATLMLHDKIETRTWATHYRGLVLICASKKSYTDEQIKNICGAEQFERIKFIYSYTDMFSNEGQAIAIGELVDCRPMRKEDEDICFVEYHPDLFCHVYKDVKEIEPFDFKGGMKWKKLTDDEINKIKIIYKH